MKRILVILISLLLAQAASAQWTVRSVPNTRLQGDEIHVSDPDGYLSDSAELAINTALCGIRDRADVFVVTLYTIGNDEPKHFATALFNYWGIGDAETDNGVLLLFVEDQRALEFETGYGAEATLTDATCARIFERTIVPYFKAGDYEGGLIAGVADIVEVYGGEVPMGVMSNLKQDSMEDEWYDYDYDYDGDESEDEMGGLGAWFVILVLLPIPVLSFFRWLIGLLSYKKKKLKEKEESFEVKEIDGINYITETNTGWSGSAWVGKGFLRFLVYGVGLVVIYVVANQFVPDLMPEATPAKQNNWATLATVFVYFTWICLAQNLMLLREAKVRAKDAKSPKAIYKKANGDFHTKLTWVLAPWLCFFFIKKLKKLGENGVAYYCPTCGSPMEREDFCPTLPKARVKEEELGVFNHTAYRCSMGHQFVERAQGTNYKSYKFCDQCGTRAVKQISSRTICEATYSHSGTKELTYSCQYCGHSFTNTETIPKLVHSSSSSGSSHHSSSHSHGSFGGGHSGGGGYSGRW